jgi:hypothetical protein
MLFQSINEQQKKYFADFGAAVSVYGSYQK